MTTWLRIPAASLAAAKAAYKLLNAKHSHEPGTTAEEFTPIPNVDGTEYFTGSSRVSKTQKEAFEAVSIVGLVTYDHWPPDATKGEPKWEPTK